MMDTSLLIQTLNFIAPLSTQVQERLHENLKEESYPKRHLLLEEGQVAKRIYFINQGFARAYYYHQRRECTTWFMGTGDFMISVYSFFTQTPANENIELMEDTKLLSLSWAKLQAIYEDFVEYNYIGRLITEKYYLMSEERAILRRTLSATERYKMLLTKYPLVMQKAKVKQIASYLDINPDTLSRIRACK